MSNTQTGFSKGVESSVMNLPSKDDKRLIVQYEHLRQILIDKNIDNRDIRIICNLYWYHTAIVNEQEKLKFGTSVSCFHLYFIYIVKLSQLALGETEEGLIINGKTIYNMRYADDRVLLLETLKELQHLV